MNSYRSFGSAVSTIWADIKSILHPSVVNSASWICFLLLIIQNVNVFSLAKCLVMALAYYCVCFWLVF